MRVLVIVVATIAISMAGVAEARIVECGVSHELAKMKSFSARGCEIDKDIDCDFMIGNYATMEVELQTLKRFYPTRLEAYFNAPNATQRFLNEDACGFLDVDCPFEANQDKKLNVRILVSPNISREPLNQMRVQLFDDDDKNIFCADYYYE